MKSNDFEFPLAVVLVKYWQRVVLSVCAQTTGLFGSNIVESFFWIFAFIGAKLQQKKWLTNISQQKAVFLWCKWNIDKKRVHILLYLSIFLCISLVFRCRWNIDKKRVYLSLPRQLESLVGSIYCHKCHILEQGKKVESMISIHYCS